MSREPFSHPDNATIGIGGERHVHVRRLGDPAAAGTDSGQDRLGAQLLGEDHAVRDADLPFQVGVAVPHRRPPRARTDVRREAPPPLRQSRLVVSIPGPVRSPQSVPHLHHVEAPEGEHEVARRVGRMRVRGHAQAPYSMDLVQALINQSVPDLVVPVDDLAGIDAEREPVPGLRGESLTAEEAREFLAGANGHRLHALFELALHTGLRKGELLGLRWEDLDLAIGVASIRRTLQRTNSGGLTAFPAKTQSSDRRIALPTECMRSLEQHCARQRQEREAAGMAWKGSGYVFLKGADGGFVQVEACRTPPPDLDYMRICG
ncbi:hypothetical protein CG723_40460 [Streptomyces sp. CB01635]|nr:hypothetical protein CG723_40460 [Streptomyces sp. CB01635]